MVSAMTEERTDERWWRGLPKRSWNYIAGFLLPMIVALPLVGALDRRVGDNATRAAQTLETINRARDVIDMLDPDAAAADHSPDDVHAALLVVRREVEQSAIGVEEAGCAMEVLLDSLESLAAGAVAVLPEGGPAPRLPVQSVRSLANTIYDRVDRWGDRYGSKLGWVSSPLAGTGLLADVDEPLLAYCRYVWED